MLTVRCSVGESLIIDDDIRISIAAIDAALVHFEIRTLDDTAKQHQEALRHSVPPPAGKDSAG